MSSIVDKFESIEGLFHGSGVSDEDINLAESTLELKFSPEFREYLSRYGVASFYGTELMGLNVPEYLDVVVNTLNARCFNDKVSLDLFVVENLRMDNLIVVSNKKGEVFLIGDDKKSRIANNFLEYIDMCIDRKK